MLYSVVFMLCFMGESSSIECHTGKIPLDTTELAACEMIMEKLQNMAREDSASAFEAKCVKEATV
jgi:hypothetical protein